MILHSLVYILLSNSTARKGDLVGYFYPCFVFVWRIEDRFYMKRKRYAVCIMHLQQSTPLKYKWRLPDSDVALHFCMVLHELYRSICYCMNWYWYCIVLDGIVWQWHWPQFSIHWKVRESLSLVGWLLCISGNDFKRYTVLTRSMYNEFTTVCSLFLLLCLLLLASSCANVPYQQRSIGFSNLDDKGGT